jgi:hypothetical protein
MTAGAPPGYFFGSDGVYPCAASSFKEGFAGQGVRCTSCEAAGRIGFTTAAAAATSERGCTGELDGSATCLRHDLSYVAIYVPAGQMNDL